VQQYKNMVKQIALFITLCLTGFFAFSQTGKADTIGIFDKLAAVMKQFQPDTTAPPNDRITRKIIELRQLRGGFNIDEMLQYKLEEDRQKKETPIEAINQFANFIQSGDGKRWLNNAVIWVYREHFTYKELKQLVRFYKTDAGKKMATDSPIIIIKSLQAAERIKETYGQQQKAKG